MALFFFFHAFCSVINFLSHLDVCSWTQASSTKLAALELCRMLCRYDVIVLSRTKWKEWCLAGLILLVYECLMHLVARVPKFCFLFWFATKATWLYLAARWECCYGYWWHHWVRYCHFITSIHGPTPCFVCCFEWSSTAFLTVLGLRQTLRRVAHSIVGIDDLILKVEENIRGGGNSQSLNAVFLWRRRI